MDFSTQRESMTRNFCSPRRGVEGRERSTPEFSSKVSISKIAQRKLHKIKIPLHVTSHIL